MWLGTDEFNKLHHHIHDATAASVYDDDDDPTTAARSLYPTDWHGCISGAAADACTAARPPALSVYAMTSIRRRRTRVHCTRKLCMYMYEPNDDDDDDDVVIKRRLPFYIERKVANMATRLLLLQRRPLCNARSRFSASYDNGRRWHG